MDFERCRQGNILQGEVRRAVLPQGFEERVRERGIVVREWAPHASRNLGALCNWWILESLWVELMLSCMESASMGVPIAAWPMHSDQPRNVVLITKVLKIGVQVKVMDWAQRDELVSSIFTVEEAVKRLMASAEGDEMRQRAKKLSNWIKQSMMEGGAARLEMVSSLLTSLDKFV